MFEPITLPFGAKMLFNTVKLKPGVDFDQVELAVGEMCNVVKETYGGDKAASSPARCSSSPVSSPTRARSGKRPADEHYASSPTGALREHEKSHADKIFTSKFERWRRCAPKPGSSATTCCGRASRKDSAARVRSAPPRRVSPPRLGD